MLRTFLKATVGFAFGFSVGIASAQSLRNADQPAEFPPASFTGKQYVDSKGCVFVRAGFDGAVSWVPRVSRSRKVLCGFKPTYANNTRPAPKPAPTTTVAAAPAPAPTKPVVIQPAPAPTRTTVASAPAPSPVRVRPQPPRQVAVVPAKPVQTQPVRTQTARVQPAAPTKVRRVPVAPRTTTTSCPEASALSQRYLNNSTYPVRCGPQPNHPAAVATRSGTPATGARAAPPPKLEPPAGYRAAFEDDRFNPNRGKQTREGFAQMRLVWTSGVPRRLVDRSTGRDVTSSYPGLRYPFISMNQQNKYVAANGWPAESGVRNSGSGVVVSSKNTKPTATPAPTRTKPTAPAGHRYVQVGTFGVPANAQASVARLQGLGLPVRVGTYKKNGKTYRTVLAGPFGSASQLSNGLNAVRRAGYRDAFTRK